MKPRNLKESSEPREIEPRNAKRVPKEIRKMIEPRINTNKHERRHRKEFII